MKTKATVILTLVALALICAPAVGDPFDDQILKFQQKPMVGTIIPDSTGVGTRYFGHDELSTAYWIQDIGGYKGEFMADDFADRFNTPVVHVTWWGSYMNTPDPVGRVQRFAVMFETDKPADATGNFSRPDQLILGQTVKRGPLSPGSGTFTETLVSPGGSPLNEAIYKYNAELALPFEQEPDTVYWLKIVALVGPDDEPDLRWGWHNRDYTVPNGLASAVPVPGERDERPIVDPTYPTEVWHFQDDAVTGLVELYLDDPEAMDIRDVIQTEYEPTYYMDFADGPGPAAGANIGNIGQFSKDLAFELYTIPEPTTLFLVLTLGLPAVLRRRRS